MLVCPQQLNFIPYSMWKCHAKVFCNLTCTAFDDFWLGKDGKDLSCTWYHTPKLFILLFLVIITGRGIIQFFNGWIWAPHVKFESCLCLCFIKNTNVSVSFNWVNLKKGSEILLNNGVCFTFKKLHLQRKWISSSVSLLWHSSHMRSFNLMLWYLPFSIVSVKIPQHSFAKTYIWYLGKIA